MAYPISNTMSDSQKSPTQDTSKTKPKIRATLSLEPTTHSFSSPQPPNLNVTLTLDHYEPITIYADDISPRLMISCGAFAIYDRALGIEVPQTKRTHCRIPPPTKAQITLNETLFHTLTPYTPYTFSAPFTRERGDGIPRAASDPECSGRQGRSSGVDGLEPGHDYFLTLAGSPRVHWYHIRWWEYGTKEEVLRSNGGSGLDARKVRFAPGPHGPIEVDSSGIRMVEFRCDV